jgi:hypothetical protein
VAEKEKVNVFSDVVYTTQRVNKIEKEYLPTGKLRRKNAITDNNGV